MSEFRVEVRRISEVYKHNNADSLELAKVNGLENQFVVGKGDMKPGDVVVYFPVDSLIPDKVLEFLPPAIKVKLTGKIPRIKTVKLRGEISQGLAVKYETVPWDKFTNENFNPIDITKNGNAWDVTGILGVTKYEPPVVHDATVDGLQLPPFAPYYDIEGCDRNKSVVDMLIQPHSSENTLMVQEKIEGTNLALVLYSDNTVEVCQRSMTIYPRDPETGKRIEKPSIDTIPNFFFANKYWDGARTGGLFEFALWVRSFLYEKYCESPSGITVRAELIGPSIQGNWYGIPKQTPYIFEIALNGCCVTNTLFREIMQKNPTQCRFAPILHFGKLSEFLNGKTIADASNGPSMLNPKKLREGIVIRWDHAFSIGQKQWNIIKQRSPEYLLKSDN